MSDYQPKVGDRVMVGEHGPYRVVFTESGAWADLRSIPENNVVADGVPLSWLTPAPEPEPAEPTAPGALVRDGDGLLLALADDADTSSWTVLTGPECGTWVDWPDLPRPITVILADPAEVERLRTERDEAANELAHLSSLNNALTDAKNDLILQRDELQRRIDAALNSYYLGHGAHSIAEALRVDPPASGTTRTSLRGES